MMHETSYKGGGHLFIVKHVDPSGEFEVGVKDHDLLFMYLREIIEKELCTGVRAGLNRPPRVEIKPPIPAEIKQPMQRRYSFR